MQENCEYPGILRALGRGGSARKARWSHPSKLFTCLPLFCSSKFISTLLLSLIKEQYVAGLTCQIFKWPLYRQHCYQAAKNRGKTKNQTNQTSGFPWLGEVRGGCLDLFEFQKNSHLSVKPAIKKKKKAILSEGQLWRHQHCWPFSTWDLSHKVNRSDYQLMNNTTPRLNFKERFLHCNLLMKIQQFKPTEFAYESLIYFRTY